MKERKKTRSVFCFCGWEEMIEVWGKKKGGDDPERRFCPSWLSLPLLLRQPDPLHHAVTWNKVEMSLRTSSSTRM